MKDKFYEMAINAILSDIETRNTQEFLDKIQSNKATEKALADFRKLFVIDKYKECTRYGKVILNFDTYTTVGWLTFKMMEIYGRKFLFILLAGDIISCYELQ